MPVGETQTFRFGPFQLDTQCGQLRKDGLGLKLQGQPVQILQILLEKSGQLVTREELRQRLWASDTFVDFDHSLNTAIKKLRQALGDEAGTPRYIETLPKRGYRFIGSVNAENSQHSSADTGPPADDVFRQIAVTLADAAITIETKSRMRTRRLRTLTLALVALLGIAIGSYWITSPQSVPRVVASRVLTKTGYPKDFLVKPLSDGRSLYFFEKRPTGWVTMQVPLAGGDTSEFHSVGWLSDISSDGLRFLSVVGRAQPPGTSLDSTPTDTWVQTLPDRQARLVVKNSDWPIWDGDDAILFLRNNPSELYRVKADGMDLKRLAAVPNMLLPHLSPDRQRIRFVAGPPSTRLWELDDAGHELRPEIDGRRLVLGGSWTADSKWYFFTHWDGNQWNVSVASEGGHWWRTPVPPQQVTFGPLSIGAPTVSADGRHLYAVGRQSRGQLSVYDAARMSFVPYFSGISACFTDFSRDGRWIAYVAYPEGTLWRSRIDGSDRRQLTIPPMAVVNPRWSPDDRLIVFTDFSNGNRNEMDFDTPHRLYLISADGGSPMLINAGPVNPLDPVWSPDGNSIAYSGSGAGDRSAKVRILDIRTQKSIEVPGSEGLWSPRWSLDGKHLVALSPGYPSDKLMLFSFSTVKWDELASGGTFDWPSWSHDSDFVFAKDGETLVRIAISNGQREVVASLNGIKSIAYPFDWLTIGWYGLTPDDRPITTRDTGIEEIYAFDLEYK